MVKKYCGNIILSFAFSGFMQKPFSCQIPVAHGVLMVAELGLSKKQYDTLNTLLNQSSTTSLPCYKRVQNEKLNFYPDNGTTISVTNQTA